ncbi:MAG: ribbon-helix-helix protein, CopG family [Acidobacteriota bacterium]
MHDMQYNGCMQTTLRIDDALYREAKAEAARSGITVTQFIEEALRLRLESGGPEHLRERESIRRRDELMEGLLRATAHFRVGPKPSREEMHER